MFSFFKSTNEDDPIAKYLRFLIEYAKKNETYLNQKSLESILSSYKNQNNLLASTKENFSTLASFVPGSVAYTVFFICLMNIIMKGLYEYINFKNEQKFEHKMREWLSSPYSNIEKTADFSISFIFLIFSLLTLSSRKSVEDDEQESKLGVYIDSFRLSPIDSIFTAGSFLSTHSGNVYDKENAEQMIQYFSNEYPYTPFCARIQYLKSKQNFNPYSYPILKLEENGKSIYKIYYLHSPKDTSEEIRTVEDISEIESLEKLLKENQVFLGNENPTEVPGSVWESFMKIIQKTFPLRLFKEALIPNALGDLIQYILLNENWNENQKNDFLEAVLQDPLGNKGEWLEDPVCLRSGFVSNRKNIEKLEGKDPMNENLLNNIEIYCPHNQIKKITGNFLDKKKTFSYL